MTRLGVVAIFGTVNDADKTTVLIDQIRDGTFISRFDDSTFLYKMSVWSNK